MAFGSSTTTFCLTTELAELSKVTKFKVKAEPWLSHILSLVHYAVFTWTL